MRKTFFKILACVLTMAVLCTSAIAVSVSDFSDVSSGDWFVPELTYAVGHNIISGTSETTFSPNGDMTRAQFVTIIGRALNGTGASTGKFTDVDESQYYIPYLYWGVAKGIITGTSDTTFHPDNPITRQDMATIIGRAINNLGLNVSVAGTPVSGFHDAGSVASYAQNSVELLRQKAILRGDTNGYLNPGDNMKRAEGMAVLARVMMNLVSGGSPAPSVTPDQPSTIPDKVWITSTGTKYHRTSTCSNMENPVQVSISYAQSKGYGPCKKCFK